MKLFQSYLRNRTQCTRVGIHKSAELSIQYCVPQSRVLGPRLFLAYVNDLCDLNLETGKIVSYADDTALIFKAQSWGETFHAAQRGFNKITQWLSQNKLTLNR